MKKSKIVLTATIIFCCLFLFYFAKLDREISNLKNDILATGNIIDVTEELSTKIYLGPESLSSDSDWASLGFNDTKWIPWKIPNLITKDEKFIEGNFAYYRIIVPKRLMTKLKGLKDQLSLSLYYVQFSELEIFLNGQFYRKNTPRGVNESILVLPMDDKKDNIIGLKARIKNGDTGVNHRIPLMLGKSSELNQIYAFAYKGQTVSTLIYMLSKGSILFIFALIFFVLKVEKFFEKFIMFGIFVVSEDVLRGDFFTGLLNFKEVAVLYNFANVGIVAFLYLFLADVVERNITKRELVVLVFGTITLSGLALTDMLNRNYFFTIDRFLRFWNVMLMLVLITFILKLFKVNKILGFIALIVFCLTGWSAFSPNFGHNYKILGNLLLFFMAAYQTFILFKKDQDLLQAKQQQLFEQEKDVAIGQTAAYLAHDVRRPLEQMRLILDRVTSGENGEEFLKAAKRDVDFSISSVNNQINDIMNFSRTKTASLKPINFYKILDYSIKQVMTINTGIDIDLEYDFKAEVFILGDEIRLSNVLTNLITNAIEAIRDIGKMQKGIIRFSTHIEGEYFIFRIFNNGPQIPRHIITEIFKPLFTAGKMKGTGLGLASVMKIIREHKGKIEWRIKA